MILEETESEKQTRLQRKRDFRKAKKLSETETDRKIRLEKDNNYHKRKFAEESEEAKRARLEKARLNYRKRKETILMQQDCWRTLIPSFLSVTLLLHD